MKKQKTSLQRRRSGPPPARRRNASMSDVARGTGRAIKSYAGRARRRLEAPEPSALQDLIATALAGGGAATLGGYIVRKTDMDPRIIAGLMMAAGAAGAFKFKGTLRTAATSIAGAGAGQFALSMMQEEAIAELKKAMADAAAKVTSTTTTPPPKPANALPSVFEQRLALHSQLNDDADRFTEAEGDYAYAQSAVG